MCFGCVSAGAARSNYLPKATSVASRSSFSFLINITHALDASEMEKGLASRAETRSLDDGNENANIRDDSPRLLLSLAILSSFFFLRSLRSVISER